jgi:hypothetical protein
MADLTLAEMETHFNMSAANRDVWEITSDDPVMQKRLEKIGATLTSKRGDLKFYTLPANQVTLRNKSTLTDEQREHLRQRAKVMFAAREAQP